MKLTLPKRTPKDPLGIDSITGKNGVYAVGVAYKSFYPLYVGQGNLFTQIVGHFNNYLAGTKELFCIPENDNTSEWDKLYKDVATWNEMWFSYKGRGDKRLEQLQELTKACSSLIWFGNPLFFNTRLPNFQSTLRHGFSSAYSVEIDLTNERGGQDAAALRSQIIQSVHLLRKHFFFMYIELPSEDEDFRKIIETTLKHDLATTRGLPTYGWSGSGKDESISFTYPDILVDLRNK